MLELYEPSKGRYSRWIVGASAIALLLYGVYGLYYSFGDTLRKSVVEGWQPLGDEFPISVALLVSCGVLISGLVTVWWAVNYPKLVDFFHDTEIELTKVSWASKGEVVGSSIVVLVTTVILMGWIAFVDGVFKKVVGY